MRTAPLWLVLLLTGVSPAAQLREISRSEPLAPVVEEDLGLAQPRLEEPAVAVLTQALARATNDGRALILKTLKGKPLPEFAKEAVARQLGIPAAAGVLGDQSVLEPAVIEALEDGLRSPSRAVRVRAAHLILAENPAHEAAGSVAEQDWVEKPVPLSTYAGLLKKINKNDELPYFENMTFASDAWDDHAPASLSSIEAHFLNAVSGDPLLAREASAFFERARRYTAYPRRIAKRLDALVRQAAQGAGAAELRRLIKEELPKPELEKARDFAYRDQVLAALPRALAQTLKDDPNPRVAGLLVAGGMAHHPVAGSDVDIIVVTRDQPAPADSDPIYFHMKLSYALLNSSGLSLSSDYLGAVQEGTPRFRREIALGAVFIPVPGR